MIKQVETKNKKIIARKILENLTEWFGLPDSREDYINESEQQTMFCEEENGVIRGYLCLKETGKDTLEIASMGVEKVYHRMGIGKKLFQAAYDYAKANHYSFIQVKTVVKGKYKEYDSTNDFYLSLGFKEFEVIPTLWDEHNPCQIYVIAIK